MLLSSELKLLLLPCRAQMNSLALELGGVQPYPLSSTLHVLV